ncbi:PepSY-associated TM helix domain-containing protein [Thalassomonas actiniarum]|uniref:PepSY domain-containing protein n=1 Tax=Thalassomonas actiniarum TaxID=485447 RepID=A0AAE9YT19_9GAMM|nr:PepSY-associated TM helix domain-containing protein [Thalassomonas actiniarum]WDD99764.1 PepSY domain-containing protein [Thalassomonas actiniarum]
MTATNKKKQGKQQKHKVVKNLTLAHSWLGVIISLVLFIVFWTGSVTMFKEEIKQWSLVPYYPVDKSLPDKPLQQIIEQKLSEYPVDISKRVLIFMPNEYYPYYLLYIYVFGDEQEAGQTSELLRLVINPKTGESPGDYQQFYLADFLYQLHYGLNLPGGKYLVGLITLLFFFALVSGIFIQGKKLFKNFFQYRSDSRRKDKLLDMHNVMGVISLPYTLMFAISGLIFNLALIYQASAVFFLYQGDKSALLSDAGYSSYSEKAAQQPLDMTSAYALIAQNKHLPHQDLVRVSFYHYGDLNAALQLNSQDRRYFAQRNESFYRVNNHKLISQNDIENYNVFRSGKDVIARLHFGNFAGVDLRILYFILGIGVCAMIVTGNMMWLDKARRKQLVSERALAFTSKITVGIFVGSVVATAAAFLAERLLPVSLAGRGGYLVNIFLLVMALVTVQAFFTADNRRFIGGLLQLTAGISLTVVLADWWIFGFGLLALWHSYQAIFGVQTGLVVFALVCLLAANHLLLSRKTKKQDPGKKPAAAIEVGN